ncbi:HU family DNA-binding protein [Acidithiobacillus ferridurans]|uniref:HU family DNA-binding protein n=2 Tax=Acidithiobacillus ferridurans TaxID=1232575 RepID=A0A8X8GBS3_ACIFI|nr:HU family DNA-binding protein [Acidithiobacillus ferridurans]MBU2724799.1 HU family DNA-binding protein [Acidithiobacillus ferridurans]MBU2725847.1 HU family DNA-binding protein [Acidithiobacillus ferridurans]
MNKQELISIITKTTNLSTANADAAVRALTEVISTALTNGDTVTISGFGTFATNERAARTGRNPATGESIEIPAKKAISFKPSKTLREAINT